MTKLYLHASTSVPSGTLPTTEQSTLTSVNDFEANQATNRVMDSNIGASQTSLANASTADTNANDYYIARWVSPIIYQAKIDANTWAYKFAAQESNAAANFPRSGAGALYVNCYVWNLRTGVKVGTILDGATATDGEEAGTSESLIECTFTGAAVTGIPSGDCVIVFEAWARVTQGNGTSRTQTFYFDGTTESSTSTNAAHISTPETLQFADTANNMTIMASSSSAIVSTANTTHYFPLLGDLNMLNGNASTTESEVQIPIRKAGTLSKFAIKITSYSVSAGNTVFVVRKNGVDTALTLTLTAAGFYEDLVNSVSFAAGDLISVKATVPGGSTGTYTLKLVTIHYAADNSEMVSVLGAYQNNAITSASSTRYYPISGRGASTSTEANTKIRQRLIGVYSNFGVVVSANARTNNTTFKTRKNGADGNCSVVYSSSQTGVKEDLVNSDNVTVGDDYNFAITTGTGTESITPSGLKIEFLNQMHSGIIGSGNTGSSADQAVNLTRNLAAGGVASPLSSVTDYRRKIRMARVTFFDLCVVIGANTITANSTVTLNLNGTATAITVTIPNSTTGLFQDVINSVNSGSNDELDYTSVTGATGTSLSINEVTINHKKTELGITPINSTLITGSRLPTVSTANTTEYWAFCGSLSPCTTEARAQFPIRKNGAMYNLVCKIISNSITGNTVITMRKNGADSNLFVTVGSSQTGVFEDLIHVEGVTAGDKFDLKSVPGGATGTFSFANVNTIFVPDDGSRMQMYLTYNGETGASFTSTSARFNCHNGGLNNGTETEAKVRQRVVGQYKFLFVYVAANARTTTTNFKTRKNGADGNLLCAVGSTATGLFEDTSNVDTIAVDDDYCFSILPGSGSESLTYTMQGVSFLSNSYEQQLVNSNTSGRVLNANTTYYLNPHSYSSTASVATQAAIKIKRSAFAVKDLYLYVNANSVTANTVVTVQKNGADATLTVTIGNSQTGLFSDVTHIDVFGLNDEFGTKYVIGASGTSISICWSALTYSSGVMKENILKWNTLMRAQSKSLVFDGSNDYLDCGNHADLWSQGLTKFSFSLWVYPTLIDSNFRDCLSHGGSSAHGIRLYYEGDNFTFAIRDSGAAEKAAHSAATPINKWYNAVCVYDSTLGANQNLAIYINKTKVSGGTLTETINNSSILSLANSSTDLQGNTKDFRWKSGVAWTQTDVDNIFDNSPSAPAPDYWLPLNEGSGNPVDRIGGKTTTISGATWADASPGVWSGLWQTLKWNTLGRVSKQNILKWNTLARVSKELILKWNTLQRISKESILKWNTLQRISKELILKFNIVGRISKESILKWNTLQRITKELILKWDVQQGLERISKEIILKWNTVARTSKENILKWNTVGRTSKESILKWNITSPVSKEIILKWNTLQRITKENILKWNTLARVSKQNILKWNTLARVSLERILKWNTLARVSKQTILKFNIVGRISKESILKWNITTRVSLERILKWNTLQRISKESILKWNILAELQRISKETILKWNTIGRTSKEVIIKYNIQQRITKQNILKWNITTPVSKEIILKWNTLARVTKESILKWNTQQRITKESILLWNTLKRVSLERIIKWNTLARITKEQIIKWNITNRISLERILKWNTLGRTSKESTLKWNTVARVSKEVILQWNVAAMLLQVGQFVENIVIDFSQGKGQIFVAGRASIEVLRRFFSA